MAHRPSFKSNTTRVTTSNASCEVSSFNQFTFENIRKLWNILEKSLLLCQLSKTLSEAVQLSPPLSSFPFIVPQKDKRHVFCTMVRVLFSNPDSWNYVFCSGMIFSFFFLPPDRTIVDYLETQGSIWLVSRSCYQCHICRDMRGESAALLLTSTRGSSCQRPVGAFYAN